MLGKWLNAKYTKTPIQRKCYQQFLRAKPFPHLVLPDFFIQKKILEVRNAILRERFERKEIDLFSFEQTGELADSKDRRITEFFKFFSSQEFIQLISEITGERVGKGADMHAHLFKEGDYLLFHDDVVEGRKVAYVANLSLGLKKCDGGRLQLFDAKRPLYPIKEIAPEFNSFVCFQVSAKSLHAVEEVLSNKQRLTLGGWFYGD